MMTDELQVYLEKLYNRDQQLHETVMCLLLGITLTQTELDQIQQDAAQEGFKWIQKPDGDWTVEKLLPQGINSQLKSNNECEHIWKEYIGFSDSFEYCNKCGKKR